MSFKYKRYQLWALLISHILLVLCPQQSIQQLFGFFDDNPIDIITQHFNPESVNPKGRNKCPSGWFACDDGECISSRWRCDGQVECKDFSDEMNCTTYQGTIMNENGCPRHQRRCGKTPYCVPEKFFCDGYFNDCPNNEDELVNCTTHEYALMSGRYECDGFKCQNHKCLPKHWNCDGFDDCGDGSDESSCPDLGIADTLRPRRCHITSGMFLCKSGKCISHKSVCDGRKDCPGGDDEGPNCDQNKACLSRKPQCSDYCYTLPTSGDTQCFCAPGYDLKAGDNSTCVDINECAIDGFCSHICLNTIGSYQCSCLLGYKLAGDNHSCIAEADEEPLMLFSTGNSIRGLWLRSKMYFEVHSIENNKHAPSQDTPSIGQIVSLFFGGGFQPTKSSEPKDKPKATSKGKVDPLDTRGKATIVGLDMASSQKEVIWAELGENLGIYATLIKKDGAMLYEKSVNIIDGGLKSPEDVAVDYIRQNIYVTDAGLPAIVVCDLQGAFCKKLVTKQIQKPRALILNPMEGWIHYTDWGDRPGIYSVGMDGSHQHALIDKDIVWPNGLALDGTTSRLYWADARLNKIEYYNMKTKERRVLIQDQMFSPFSLAVFEDTLYWSDWGANDIKSCNKFTGHNLTIVMRTENIYGIHIYHPLNHEFAKDEAKKPCWSKHCSHLCLIGPRIDGHQSAQCACPEGMKFSQYSENQCVYTDNSFVLVNVKNMVAQMDPETIRHQVVGTLLQIPEYRVHDITMDLDQYRLYFFDAATHHIYTMEMTPDNVMASIQLEATGGASHESLVARAHDEIKTSIQPFIATSQAVRGLTYDPFTNNLYWIDVDRGTMSMCSVKGQFERVIKEDMERPISMVLDRRKRYFYIALLGSLPHIIRTDIDGKNEVSIIGAEIGLPVALHLDQNKQRLYWADARRGTIESLDLNTSAPSGIKPDTRRIHRSGLNAILALTIHAEHFIWVMRESDLVYRAPIEVQKSSQSELATPTSYKLPSSAGVIDSAVASSDNKKLILCKSDPLASKSPCHSKGCSHGCILNHKLVASCVCPENYVLDISSNATQCYEDKLDCPLSMFKCTDGSHCLLQSWKCDGTEDCDNASDEKDCKVNTTCPAGDFQCANGRCLTNTWKCDGSDDCGDGSDEISCPESILSIDKRCTVGYFNCGDGQCITQLWQCDHEVDCKLNAKDEENCEPPRACHDKQFRCKNGHCIPKVWVCDGHKDCTQGEDEDKCSAPTCKPGEQFLCDHTLCMDIRFKCDRIKQCQDGTDEKDCSYTEKPCPPHMVACPSDHHCIYESDVCDGHQDCEDGFDEKNCTNHRECKSYEIRCDGNQSVSFVKESQWRSSAFEDAGDNTGPPSNKCIPTTWLCDGANDCGDWSDEIRTQCMPPSYDQMLTTTSRPCHDGSYPCKSGECIKWSQVCNEEADCIDGSDEAGLCQVSCSRHNGGCAQRCRSSPVGPSCACNDGYVLSNDTKTCDDFDECQHGVGICSQICINTKGAYKCECAPGYMLAEDRRHCKAVGEEDPSLLFMLPNRIISSGVTRYNEMLVALTDDVDMMGMDYDYRHSVVFWSERDRGRIMSASMAHVAPHGSELTQIWEIHDLVKPGYLAWDWLAGNMYFATHNGLIQVCNMPSRKCTTMFNGSIINGSSLVVAPTFGYMFWGVSSAEPTNNAPEAHRTSGIIERADMDGTHRKVIVNDKIEWPMGLAVDQVLSRLYWVDSRVDEISSVDFDGRYRQLILAYSLSRPTGLAVFEDNLFVSNLGSDTIIRCNKFTGGSRITFKKDDVKADVVKIVHEVAQPNGTNYCQSNTCDYMCALNTQGHKCLCPVGKMLSNDNITCHDLDPTDCAGDHSKCQNGGLCREFGKGWRCDCPYGSIGTFCESGHVQYPLSYGISHLSLSHGGAYDQPLSDVHESPLYIWLIVILVLASVATLMTVSFMLVYRRGHLPSNLTGRFSSLDRANLMTVSFKPGFSRHDKGDEEILIDQE